MYFCVKNTNVFPVSLTRLQHLSVLDNKLEELPVEVGHLTRLSEINLTSNNLSQLPQQLYQCKELTKVYAARNKLTSLPEVGVHSCDIFFLDAYVHVAAT